MNKLKPCDFNIPAERVQYTHYSRPLLPTKVQGGTRLCLCCKFIIISFLIFMFYVLLVGIVMQLSFGSNIDNNPNHTPHSSSTYELILSIYHTVNSIEAVRQDMLRMDVVMNERCGLIYTMVLLKNGRTTELLKFIEEDLVLRVSTHTNV